MIIYSGESGPVYTSTKFISLKTKNRQKREICESLKKVVFHSGYFSD